MPNRKSNGQFAKGTSGNPGGRPKADLSLRGLARQHTGEAIETLLKIMRSERSPASARVTAAVALLDRGYGRPLQALEVDELTQQHKPPTEIDMLDFGRKVALALYKAGRVQAQQKAINVTPSE